MTAVEIIVDIVPECWDTPSCMAAVVLAIPVRDRDGVYQSAVGWVVSTN